MSSENETPRILPTEPGWWWADGYPDPLAIVIDEEDGVLVVEDDEEVTWEGYRWRCRIPTAAELDAQEAELAALREEVAVLADKSATFARLYREAESELAALRAEVATLREFHVRTKDRVEGIAQALFEASMDRVRAQVAAGQALADAERAFDASLAVMRQDKGDPTLGPDYPLVDAFPAMHAVEDATAALLAAYPPAEGGAR